jgi:hypothetical protein
MRLRLLRSPKDLERRAIKDAAVGDQADDDCSGGYGGDGDKAWDEGESNCASKRNFETPQAATSARRMPTPSRRYSATTTERRSRHLSGKLWGIHFRSGEDERLALERDQEVEAGCTTAVSHEELMRRRREDRDQRNESDRGLPHSMTLRAFAAIPGRACASTNPLVRATDPASGHDERQCFFRIP